MATKIAGGNTGQDAFFFDGEGDSYYRRNREVLRSRTAEYDPPLRLLHDYSIRPGSVLELGCANGWRLELLRRAHGCRAVGVEPSLEAVAEGRRDYPEVELHRGTLADVPIAEASFDLVVVHFVFHWNSRQTLLSACANVDRFVREGGHLLLGDFLPDHPLRRRYHHAASGQAHTYKQDYARIFLASNLYREVARLTFDADARADPWRADVAASGRGVCSLMRRSLDEGYPLDPES